MSLALAGGCLGQFVLVPVFSTLVIDSGWRITSLWIAGLSLVLNLALASGVVRGDPPSSGFTRRPALDGVARRADAHLPREPPSPRAGALRDRRPSGLTLSEALRTRSL